MALIYVLPVHNEAAILARNVENLRGPSMPSRVRASFWRKMAAEILPSHRTRVAAQPDRAGAALTIASAGIGHAYDLASGRRLPHHRHHGNTGSS